MNAQTAFAVATLLTPPGPLPGLGWGMSFRETMRGCPNFWRTHVFHPSQARRRRIARRRGERT